MTCKNDVLDMAPTNKTKDVIENNIVTRAAASGMKVSANIIKVSMMFQHFFGLQGTVPYELQEKSLKLLVGHEKASSFVGMLNMTTKTYGIEQIRDN